MSGWVDTVRPELRPEWRALDWLARILAPDLLDDDPRAMRLRAMPPVADAGAARDALLHLGAAGEAEWERLGAQLAMFAVWDAAAEYLRAVDDGRGNDATAVSWRVRRAVWHSPQAVTDLLVAEIAALLRVAASHEGTVRA